MAERRVVMVEQMVVAVRYLVVMDRAKSLDPDRRWDELSRPSWHHPERREGGTKAYLRYCAFDPRQFWWRALDAFTQHQ